MTQLNIHTKSYPKIADTLSLKPRFLWDGTLTNQAPL